MNTRTIDRTYHDAVRDMLDVSQAGIPAYEGATIVPSDLLPLIQVSAYARIQNEQTGHCTYVFTADAHAFTLNGINYWRASLTLTADDEKQSYLAWTAQHMSREPGDRREPPKRAQAIVMDELRRAIQQVRNEPGFHERARADAYRRRIKEYEDTIIDRNRRIDHLTTLLDPSLDLDA